MKNEYTITVFCENYTGVLSRIVGLVTRRHINIESINASQSSIDGIFRITMVVCVTEETIKKLVLQIDKQIDILKAFYYTNEEIVHQEVALYKIPSESFFKFDKSEELLRKYNARILSMETEYIVVEKTGHESETKALLKELKTIGIFEFVRSGRVAIIKPMERLNQYLESINQL